MKKFFHPGLYREAMAQLRLPALIIGITTLILSALLPITSRLGMTARTFVAAPVHIFALAAFALLAFYLMPFVLGLRAFSFLNRRNRSDFYHALPIGRPALFFSLVAAELSWTWATLIVTVASNSLLYLVLGAHVSLASASIICVFMLTGSLFLCAATTLAMSVTGTTLANIVVTLLIVCLPRYVASLFAQSVSSGVPNLPAAYAGIFDIHLTNTLFTLPLALSGSDAASTLANVANLTYTIISALLVFALALWLFVRRRSEDADKSAPGRGLQLVYRVGVSLLPALALVPLLTGLGMSETGYRMPALSEVIIPVLVLGIISFIIFCVFELLTSKSWKSLARAIPSFGIVIIVVLGFVALVTADIRYEGGFKPTADAIEWVRVIRSRDYQISDLGFEEEGHSYNDLLAAGLHIDSPALKKAVAVALKSGNQNQMLYENGESLALVEVKAKGRQAEYRTIHVNTGQKSDAFSVALLASPDVAKALLGLPKAREITEIQADLFLEDDPASQREHKKILDVLWKKFTQEYETLSPADRFAVLYQNDFEQRVASDETTSLADFNSFSVNVSGSVGLEGFSCTYPLNNLLPRTTEYAIGIIQGQIVSARQKKRVAQPGDTFSIWDSENLMVSQGLSEESGATNKKLNGEPLYTGTVSDGEEETEDSAGTVDEMIAAQTFTKAMNILLPALKRPLDPQAVYYAQLYLCAEAADDGSLDISYTFPITEQEKEALMALRS